MFLHKRVTLFLISFILLAFLLNFASLNYYFFQDDWFVLNTVKDIKINNILSLFHFRNDIVYYRPIGMQSFFLLAYSVFGRNPMLFHLSNFAFFAIDIVLTYFLAKQISGNKKAGLLAAFFFSTASFNYMTLSWLSLTWNFIGLGFFMTSLILLAKRKRAISFALFFFSLLSTEFAITYPFFACAVLLAKTKKIKKLEIAKYLLPSLGTILIYLLIRILLVTIPTEGTYKPIISLSIAKDYLWYILWFLNVPEILKTHLNITEFKIAEDFVRDTNSMAGFIAPLLIIELGTLFILFRKSVQKLKPKLWATCIGLFIISLGPVITLPNHSYPYYLTIASLPLIYLISTTLASLPNKRSAKIISGIYLGTWLIASALSLEINDKTHWIPGEQSISRKIVSQANSSNHNLTNVYVYPTTSMTSSALMDQEAMKFIYNKSVTTTYLRKLNKEAKDNSQLIIWDK